MCFGMIKWKNKYGEKVKFCCVDKDGFKVYIKAGEINIDITEDVKTRFNMSSYELKRPLPVGKKQKSYWINERWIRCKQRQSLRYWN